MNFSLAFFTLQMISKARVGLDQGQKPRASCMSPVWVHGLECLGHSLLLSYVCSTLPDRVWNISDSHIVAGDLFT